MKRTLNTLLTIKEKNCVSSNKVVTLILLILLIVSLLSSMTFLETVNARTPPFTIATYAYITVAPNPIGVEQTCRILIWLDQTFSSGAIGNTYRFHNYELTITAPDGTNTTQTFAYISDPTSSQGYDFTPSQVGIYTLTFEFPGQAYNTYDHDPASAYVNDTYGASSDSTTLTVQQTPISYVPSVPLPVSYWTRPIYGENIAWYTISSNWLGTGSPQLPPESTGTEKYVPDAVGPITSHIMWTKPLQSGGVVGGSNTIIQGDTYFDGTSRLTRYANPIILNGKIFYTEPVSMMGTSGPTDCVDLRTGQLIWSRSDVPPLSFGYIYDVQTTNNHGVIQPILYTANFARAFDADTGIPLYNVTNVPSGSAALGPNGEVLRYVFANAGNNTNPQWYLAQWNSSKLWDFIAQSITYENITGSTVPMTGGILPGNVIIDASVANPTSAQYRYDWNVSIPWLNVMGNQTLVTLGNLTNIKGWTTTGLPPTGNPDASNPVSVVCVFNNDVMICRNGSLPTTGLALSGISTTPYTYFAVNLNSSIGAIGSILWMQTYDLPPNNINVFQGGFNQASRVFVEYYKQTAQWVGYSMTTGQRLWTTSSQTDLNGLEYYGNIRSGAAVAQFAYGKLYTSGFGGVCFCYDLSTGNLLWTYGNSGLGNSTNGGFETGGETYYPTFIDAIANGVVYLSSSEHTIQTPIYPGALKRAINATDGTEIWTLSGWTTGGGGFPAYALADGFETWFNGYDDQIYVVGRGPSALTVESPLADVTLGQGLIIQGTLTDTSAGTKLNAQVADFPNGVPVASDVSMKDWMGHVYQQKPLPTSFTGVDVTIDVLDSNNNYRNIGTAQTDSTGAYSLHWVPDIPGKYTVIATFHGTNGYWPSYSETSFAVDNAATPAPTEIPLTDIATNANLMTFLAVGVIAIIIAIAIVGLLILRKRA